MHRTAFIRAILIALAAFGSGILPGPSALWAQGQTTTLNPVSYKTIKGATGGQPVDALFVKDQSGLQDDWDHYLEFLTPESVYRGYRIYRLPATVDVHDITGMQVAVNWRGPLKPLQTWTWKIYDWEGRRWLPIGNNAGAGDWWVWWEATFNVPSPFGRFINSNRLIRVLTQSNNAADNADLDYEAVLVTSDTPRTWWRPAVQTSWQIQFSGTLDTGLDVEVYDLDGFDTPKSTVDALHARGIKVMCYFSAGSRENWRPDKAKFPASVLGKPLAGWAGERWLDIRRLDVLGPIMEARLDIFKAKGCDGVDPDNVDGYTNDTGFPLTYDDQLAYNIFLAKAAHQRGLGIGLKNDIDQVEDLLPHFDWQLNEQCFQYDECNKIVPFVTAGKPVFHIEYQLATDRFCPRANTMNFNSLRKHLSLDAYREACR